MLTQKKEERKEKAKFERLNYTSCSRKDRRGVGNVASKANVAIRDANGRRKQGSLNRSLNVIRLTLGWVIDRSFNLPR